MISQAPVQQAKILRWLILFNCNLDIPSDPLKAAVGNCFLEISPERVKSYTNP